MLCAGVYRFEFASRFVWGRNEKDRSQSDYYGIELCQQIRVAVSSIGIANPAKPLGSLSSVALSCSQAQLLLPVWGLLILAALTGGKLLQCIKAFLDSGVIYPQELVRTCNHIHFIWFALGALFVKELISRLMIIFILQDAEHYLE